MSANTRGGRLAPVYVPERDAVTFDAKIASLTQATRQSTSAVVRALVARAKPEDVFEGLKALGQREEDQ